MRAQKARRERRALQSRRKDTRQQRPSTSRQPAHAASSGGVPPAALTSFVGNAARAGGTHYIQGNRRTGVASAAEGASHAQNAPPLLTASPRTHQPSMSAGLRGCQRAALLTHPPPRAQPTLAQPLACTTVDSTQLRALHLKRVWGRPTPPKRQIAPSRPCVPFRRDVVGHKGLPQPPTGEK